VQLFFSQHLSYWPLRTIYSPAPTSCGMDDL
jgi:hypothetical protein